jgi:hypothetical protein
MQRPKHWRSASYSDWNEWLVEHTFDKRRTPAPVDYIPASPEDLCAIVSEAPEHASQVVQAFAHAITEELKKEGCTFERYCLLYRLPNHKSDVSWSPLSQEEPYFFGCLWLTCLVASGYPANESKFYTRMRMVLGIPITLSSGEYGSLEDIWEDLADWTKLHGDKYRELRLPERDGYRKIIGRSFYLAFPNQLDRHRLRAILDQKNLLGGEPSIGPIIAVLLRAKEDFSTEFQLELQAFVDRFLKGGQEPKESSFWRAVRQEVAITPGQDRATGGAERTGQTTLMARFDDDELLEPYIACTEEYPDRPGFTRRPLDFTAGEFRYRLEPEASSPRHLSFEQLLTGTAKRTYQQGIVPLLNISTGEYRLAQGEEVAGCERGLIRDDRVGPFLRTFGGKQSESALQGWQEIARCQLHQLDETPQGLEGVTTLLHSTEPQKPFLAGGLRTSTGAFYRLKGYLPRIHAPGAEKVELWFTDRWVPCVRPTTGEQPSPEWLIPEEIDLEALGELRVAATWKVHIEGYPLERQGETRAALVQWDVSLDYKGLPSGTFWLETTSRQLHSLSGPTAEVPLGFTTQDSSRAMDTLFFDAATRWLGPGVGEMSLTPRADFAWLASGPKKAPSMVVFIGDPAKPVLPDGGFSPVNADRRHWKQTFSGGRPAFVRRGSEYVPISEDPAAQSLYAAYAKAARDRLSEDGRSCVPTRLDSFIDDEASDGGDYSKEATLLVDVLSIIVQSRSGIPLREVHEHLARLTGTDEQHALRYHLLRALADVGAIDTLLRTDGRRTIVVARRPRLVIVRSGNRFRATIMGLLRPTNIKPFFQDWQNRLEITFSAPPNPFQPPVVRVAAKDGTLQPLVDFSRALAFTPHEFLDWPETDQVPEHFAIRDELSRTVPPDMYEPDGKWCWKIGAFLRTPEDRGEVSVERRKDDKRAPIYVVMRGAEVLGWSYSRSWALLDAAEKAGRAPFVLDGRGILRTAKIAPMHLPLPLARLCTVVGTEVPGPRVEQREGRLEVTAYTYPFGKRLVPLVTRAVPESWIQRKVE